MKQFMKGMLKLRVGYDCPSLKKIIVNVERNKNKNVTNTYKKKNTHTKKMGRGEEVISNGKVILFWPRLLN